MLLHIIGLMAISLAFSIGIMLAFWGLYLIYKNVNLLDIGWSLSLVAATIIYFIFSDGFIWRKVLILTLVSVWALRLIFQIAAQSVYTSKGWYYGLLLVPCRGEMLKELGLFVFMGMMASVLSLPFALISANPLPFFSPAEVFGLLLWTFGVIGESIADWQTYNSLKLSSEERQVPSKWRFVGHPRYAFEWIVWLSYFVIALSSQFGWLAILSPLIIIYALIRIKRIFCKENNTFKQNSIP